MKTKLIPSSLALAAALLPATTQAAVIVTTNPADAAAFLTGATIENFDNLTAFAITSYAAGQTIDAGAKFSSRNGATQPTYHSGGASFNDPVGNPGTPIGIFEPQGGIQSEVVSPKNVAGPLAINTDEPFNNGFMEIIFPAEADRVGFWVTHGKVRMDVRDNTGTPHNTGDFEVTGEAGQFIGISRAASDIKIAALIGIQNPDGAFAIDDFGYAAGSTTTVPDTGTLANLMLAGAALLLMRRKL